VRLAERSRSPKPGQLDAYETRVEETLAAAPGRPATTTGGRYFLWREYGRQRVPHAGPIGSHRHKLNVCKPALDL
jgi:hypothetical protein